MSKDNNTPIIRKHRKEIQYSDEEWRIINAKAIESQRQPAVYIREASLGHQMQAAMTASERELYQRSTGISSRYMNNLNQLVRLMHTFPASKPLKKTVLEFVKRADHYLQTGEYKPLNLDAIEKELKALERSTPSTNAKPAHVSNVSQYETEILKLKEKNRESEYRAESAERSRDSAYAELDKKNKEYDSLFEMSKGIVTECESWKARAMHYFYFSAKGQEEYMKKNNFTIYPDNRGVNWFIKEGTEFAQNLQKELWLPWRQGEISIAELYQRWCEEYKGKRYI